MFCLLFYYLCSEFIMEIKKKKQEITYEVIIQVLHDCKKYAYTSKKSRNMSMSVRINTIITFLYIFYCFFFVFLIFFFVCVIFAISHHWSTHLFS